MRRVMLMSAALLLTGCEEPQKPAELVALENACASGNLDACQYLDQRRAQMAQVLMGMQAQNYQRMAQPVTPITSVRRPTVTNCNPSGYGVQCTTY